MADSAPEWLVAALPGLASGHGALAAGQLAAAGTIAKSGFSLTSPAFANGEPLDPSFTADEEDAVAPPLEWSSPPAGTQELALIVEDPDGRDGRAICHWLVWGLAGQRGKLLEGEVPPRVGKNAKRNSEWLLPEPPHDDPPHTYVFQLFALDLPLTLMPGASREDLVSAMQGHVLAAALLTATYAREEGDEDWDNDDDVE
ncbi:MAG: YbhB/YbcL family Raf kinase inhibitor-like protein [Sphingomonadaceae bacterium]